MFNKGDEYYAGSAKRGNDIRFSLPEGDGYKAVMFVGLGDGNRLLGVGVPTSSDAPDNGINSSGNINIKTGTKTMTFTLTALTADIGAPGASGNLTIASKDAPDKSITINETKEIPYFILAEAPYEQVTDITGAFSIDGFPADVGGVAANGLVGVVGGAVVDAISTLIYSDGTAIPPLLVTPKEKTAAISGGKVNIGFKLTTSVEAGFDWGFSRLWFDVAVQAFTSGAASGDNKRGSVWHVSNGLDASYDRGAEVNSAGRDILLYIGEPTKVGDSGSEAPIILPETLDLTYKVLAPVKGGSPVTSFFAGTYGGTVEWTPFPSGLFGAGTEYTAKVTLYPAAGYVFADSGVKITHTGATDPAIGAYEFTHEAGGDPGTVTGDVVFPQTADAVIILNYDLQAYVPAPVPGAAPVKSIDDRVDMTVEVVWKDADGNDITGSLTAFADATVYTADITLTAKPGYAFDTTVSFKYHPDDAVATQPDDDTAAMHRILTTVTYNSTAAPTEIPTPVDLTSLIPAPVKEGSPVTSFFAGTYGGTVEWTPSPSGLFEAETEYTATVTLYPAPGYAFPAGDVPVKHTGAKPIELDPPPDPPDPLLHYVYTFTHGSGDTVTGDVAFPSTGADFGQFVPFSGEAGKEDSFIDMIQKAKDASRTYQVIVMPFDFPEEEVNLGAANRDVTGGLSLTTTNSPANLTLDGGGRVIKLTYSGTTSAGSVIKVGDGVTLTLRNITFQGSASNNQPLITVDVGGTLVLEDGAVITGNQGSSSAGGVLVNGDTQSKTGGTFIMNGGTISGNTTGTYGGVVYLKRYTTFTMNGGTISGNTTGNQGGAVNMSNHNITFTMNGGTISGNTTGTYGGGVYMDGNGTFTMNGGTITKNKSSGVFMMQGVFAMKGGTISGNTASLGGGVYLETLCTFTMSGGTISGNTGSQGGGVYVYTSQGSGTFIKTGGTIYGKGDPLANTAKDDNSGHAVFGENNVKKIRNTTAGPEVLLDSTKTKEQGGGWE